MRENGNIDLSVEVKELLWQHECVILPNLGAIITRTSEAALNPYSHLIKPKSKSIFFNPGILQTDGLLANHIADKYGMGYANAVKALEKEVETIKNEISNGKKIQWKGLGEFFGTSEKVFFIPAQDTNFLQETFGLFPISLTPVAQSTQEIKVEIAKPLHQENKINLEPKEVAAPISAMTPEHNTPLAIEHKPKGIVRFIKWAVAAALVGFLVFTAIKNEDRTFYTHQEATIIPNLMENGAIIDNVEEPVNYNDSQTPIDPLESNSSLPNETALEQPTPTLKNNSETVVAAPEVPKSIDPVQYDLVNRYHIIIYKTIMEENVTGLLEKGKYGSYNPYILRLKNSKLIRVALFSSNQLAEAEEKLNAIQTEFSSAELLDKKQYNHL